MSDRCCPGSLGLPHQYRRGLHYTPQRRVSPTSLLASFIPSPSPSLAAHKDEGLYFRADPSAEYAARYTIDLSHVVPQVALYPSPDNCQPVPAVAGMKMDGAFIGACTTTQEDLILGALLLEAMMKAGHSPVPVKDVGQRRVTPGSLQIIEHLKKHGLVDIYEKAGFVVGVPGCSYCLGIAADVAGDGEVWLTSQNRNFKNR